MRAKFLRRSDEPPVSVILPYKEGDPVNNIYLCENDELIVVTGEGIGYARIVGALCAKNDWLVFVDSDAVYPQGYIPKIKKFIRKFGDYFSVFATQRIGGILENPPPLRLFTYEHGLIVRRDEFMMRCLEFLLSDHLPRDDIGGYFTDAMPIPVIYYHGLTTGETYKFTTLLSMGIAGLLGLIIFIIMKNYK